MATNKSTNSFETEDFSVSNFFVYTGPNYYLNKKAVVFNLYLSLDGPSVNFYKKKVLEKFPNFESNYPEIVAELFTQVIVAVNKIEIELFSGAFSIEKNDDEYTIAIEYVDDYLTEEVVYFVSDWFDALNKQEESFNFNARFEKLQEQFNNTIYGSQAAYSLVEAATKRGIPVSFLYEENQFQWGYGKKQRRGRSSIFHTDSIKDTEFTEFKDLASEFLALCGFPVPEGNSCFSAEDLIFEAKKIGFPVVVKPVAGYKGFGVKTGINSVEQLKEAYQNILNSSNSQGIAFNGAIVQKHISGNNYRLLAVDGKFEGAIMRVPPFVIGDGKRSIQELIDKENKSEARQAKALSPLVKIRVDDKMLMFLQSKNKDTKTVPGKNEKVFLRDAPNISTGGVSINKTSEVHPHNISLIENIVRFFNITTMAIDVITDDISVSWSKGDLSIIDIIPGPNVFMYFKPAIGNPIDIPGRIMSAFFSQKGKGRIPIIAGNNLNDEFIQRIYLKCLEKKEDIKFGSLRKDGVYFNNIFFCNNQHHDENCKILFRNPKLEFAVLNHNRKDIYDYGIWHEGLDVAILHNPNYAEDILERDLTEDGFLFFIEDRKTEDGQQRAEITVIKNNKELNNAIVSDPSRLYEMVFHMLEPYLESIIHKYD